MWKPDLTHLNFDTGASVAFALSVPVKEAGLSRYRGRSISGRFTPHRVRKHLLLLVDLVFSPVVF